MSGTLNNWFSKACEQHDLAFWLQSLDNHTEKRKKMVAPLINWSARQAVWVDMSRYVSPKNIELQYVNVLKYNGYVLKF